MVSNVAPYLMVSADIIGENGLLLPVHFLHAGCTLALRFLHSSFTLPIRFLYARRISGTADSRKQNVPGELSRHATADRGFDPISSFGGLAVMVTVGL